MSQPSEPERGEPTPTRVYTLVAVALLIVVAIATAASWHLYPVFIDTYYHMAVIEGFSQAGGITTRAFWEMAPGGRVHIYPPSLHVIGYFFYLLGVSPGTFMTLVSGTVLRGLPADDVDLAAADHRPALGAVWPDPVVRAVRLLLDARRRSRPWRA